MKNVLYKNFLKSIIADLLAFLIVDINSKVNSHKRLRGEIYTNDGNYVEIVGMRRRKSLFKWFLPTSLVNVIFYRGKLEFKKNIFSLNKRVFTVLE